MAAAAAPDAFAASLMECVAAVVAAGRPAPALVTQLQALAQADQACLGVALFESIHYRLPAFADDDLPEIASRLYARSGRADAAWLLAGLAVQLKPADPARRAVTAELRPGVPDRATAAKTEAIVASHIPGPLLLLALEALDAAADRAGSAALFEGVWPRVRPLADYWVYHRMAQVYDALGRQDASVLLATLAIQLEPHSEASDGPYRLLLRAFRQAGRLRDAAELCVRRHRLCPSPPLLPEAEFAALLAAAGPLCLSPPPAGRIEHALFDREIRAPRPWPAYGGDVPNGLRELLRPMTRPPIAIAELQDAEILLDGGATAIYAADGTPQLDLSVRTIPALQRRRMQELADVEEIELDAAVLISDEFPGVNLCHFMLDHATRLALYQRVGVAVGQVTVIGPPVAAEYQRVVAERLGVRAYLSVARRARVRAAHLWVSSNCHSLRHPGHWGAAWATGAIRELFDLAPRPPARRLLVSREDSPWRRIRNHAMLADMLAPLGFEVIVPGRLSFAEQVAAFRDASHVIASHGAALANILFCAPGTHVLEVFHPHYGTWAYAMLNAPLGLNYASMVARDADSDAPEFNDPTLPREAMVGHAGRDMRVDLDELERWLEASGAW